MIRHIHFCSIGSKWQLPVAVCKSGLEVNKIYLLNSVGDDEYADIENTVRDRLSAVNITNIEKISIDPFDFDDVYLKVLSKCSEELSENKGNCKFHFNFTSGTNIVAGAICSAAHLVPNVDFYYLQEGKYRRPPSAEDKIIHIESPSSDDLDLLRSKKQTAQIFNIVAEHSEISNKNLSSLSGKQPSALSYHTDILLRRGLIERVKKSSEDKEFELDNARAVWKLSKRGIRVFDAFRLRSEMWT